MKYDVQFTNQFKKDLKLAKSRTRIWINCLRLSIFLQTAVRWMPDTKIMVLQAIIKEHVSVTLNRTGC